ncbi:glycosyltransferase [Acidithiobacillus sp. MC6.1]|nr:glycosyltransferase [Acidithiobacillus sp. MC6.1]
MTSKPILLIPARDEAHHLPELLQEWAEHGALHTDLCLVLDNCTDDSHAIVSGVQASENFPPFTAVTTVDNRQGKAGAITYALDRFPDQFTEDRFVVLWDADREYALPTLPAFLEGIPENAEARAWTMLSGKRSGLMLRRSVMANSVIRACLAFTTGRRPPRDVLSGVRAMQCGHLVQALCGSSGFDMETRLVRYFLENEGTILEWPVRYQPRLKGKKIKVWDLPALIKAALI